MRTLQNSFAGRASQSGWTFELVEREDHRAIYKKTDQYNNIYFEAIRIKIVGDSIVGGNVIVGGERYPGDSSFGTEAWCCSSLDRAREFYNNITYTTNEG